mgnify:CR=1 FL=1
MKKETYKFIYKTFTGSNILKKQVFLLLLISISGAIFEIGFLSLINFILQPDSSNLIFTNLLFIGIIFLCILFAFFKVYILHFCSSLVNLLSRNLYKDSYIFSINKSLNIWNTEESSFITNTTISTYRIVSAVIVPITFAIPPFVVSIFLSLYLTYKYPFLVLVGIISVFIYYFIIIKIFAKRLKKRSTLIQNQEKRLRAILTLSFRDRLNLFINGSFTNITRQFESSNKKIRKAESETIFFNNGPRAALEVAIYMIVIFVYYILIFNNKTSELGILPGELAVILICFQRLSSIANQIYGVIASVGSNNSQLEELINNKMSVDFLNDYKHLRKINFRKYNTLSIIGNSNYYKNPFIIKDRISISPGEITTIEGDSGVGKTSFCQLLMLSQYKEKIGNNIIFRLQNEMKFIKSKNYLGSLFCLNSQNLLIDGITALEFLEYANPKNKKQIPEVISYLFNENISDNILSKNYNLNDLSGGEFQRLLIARTIISDLKFVFLDETTSGLDNTNELRCIDYLRNKNIGILIISHKGISKKYANNRYLLKRKEDKIEIENIF